MTRSTVRRKVTAGVGAGFALALLLALPASAVPPGGPGADTPGTSAEVSPTSLSPGDKISFTLRGFPAGETVNVKIDDGEVCGEAAVHGACVVYKKKISSGTTSGSFRAPKELKPGSHTLRFLASKPIKGSGGGIEGFTLRSPEFTIVSDQKSSQSNSTEKQSNSSEKSTSSSTSTTSTSPTPSPTTKKSEDKKSKDEKSKEKKDSTAETVSTGDVAMVTPEPVTAVVTGSGLSVAQAIGIGGGAVGLAAVVGGLTAWWRRGGLG